MRFLDTSILLYAVSRAPAQTDKRDCALALLIDSWLRFHVEDITLPILQAAMQASMRFQLSYWDAAIIEAARAAGCTEVYSEDLNTGQSFSGIRIVNPFV